MITFLANENFPLPSTNLLRQAGFNVITIADSFPGISDKEVIRKATEEHLIILTFDKDYGEIIFKYALEKPPAVIFFRFKGDEPETAGRILLDLILKEKIDVVDSFIVVEKNGIRQRNY